MRLKSIKLAGFKSFVDATTVPFPTNMTAIVGPNGCGKSNIIDAVRWVMGESSAKYLRGESMTDVIFNGSTGRQPVGQASIELLFDNSEGKLGGEHGKFAELSIRRKVTREGLSQYYLNGTKCRRRDVTDIFLGTGMGPRSYAIIEQGMISRLIESRPEELRVYLEEAAGISKYKERRRETETRMKRTEENLERLADIRDELDKQLQHLKRQAASAEKYAEYKAEERLTQARLSALRWSVLHDRTQAQQLSIEEYEQGIETLILDKVSNEARQDALRTDLEDRQDAFNRQQARYYETGAEVARIEQQLKFQKQRRMQLNHELAQLQEELSTLQHREQQEEQRLQEVLDIVAALMPESDVLAANYEQVSEQLAEREQQMRQWQQRWEHFNSDVSRLRQNAEVAQNSIQYLENRIRQLQTRQQLLLQENVALQEQKLDSDKDALLEQCASHEDGAQDIAQTLLDLRDHMAQERSILELAQVRRAALATEVAEQRAVLASLRTLQEGALGASIEIQEHYLVAQGITPVRLIQQAQVEPGWERAVEHVLDSWLCALVVDDAAGLWAGDVPLQGTTLTVIQVDKQQSLRVDAGQKTLAQCVSGIDALLPQLSQVYVVDTDAEARAMCAQLSGLESVVSRSGLWLSAHWLRYRAVAEQSDSLLLRQERMNELDQRIPQNEQALSLLDAELEQRRLQVRTLETQLHQTQQTQHAQVSELSRLKSRLSAEQAKQAQISLRIERNESDRLDLVQSLENEQMDLMATKETWDQAMSELHTLSDGREIMFAQKEQCQFELDQLRHQSRSLQDQVHQAKLQQQRQLGEKAMLEQSLATLHGSRARLEQRRSTIESSDPVGEDELQALELKLEGLLEARLQDEEKLSALRLAMEQVTQTLRQIELQRHQFDARLQERRSALEALRMSQQALSINQENLLAAVERDDFVLAEVLTGLEEGISDRMLEDQLLALAQRIQRLGPINLAAIDEYNAQSERKDYLDRQHNELMAALETLHNAIRKIDRETRAKFKETYDQVNDGLQRLFPKIFGGGMASLSLTDDDLLETGVSILARPPGKKNATIHLLSGGEKALTALALIFAIFELNPAPFCMLDEVDAPLDDANVGRFANLVKDMSKQVQFIYISHNKISMEQADHLMGVTMHEPGVSRLVAVNVEEAAALAEA